MRGLCVRAASGKWLRRGRGLRKGTKVERIEFSKRLAIEQYGKGITLLADGHPVVTLTEKDLKGLREALGWANPWAVGDPQLGGVHRCSCGFECDI